jgi:hypothetical protein
MSGRPWPIHEFVPLSFTYPNSCVKCGRQRDHPIHSNREEPDTRLAAEFLRGAVADALCALAFRVDPARQLVERHQGRRRED